MDQLEHGRHAPYESAAATVLPELAFEYNDGYYMSVGAEYDFDATTKLRFGAAYELSPLDVENRSFRLPDGDRVWLTTGASFALNDRTTIDLGYAYIHGLENTIDRATTGGSGPASNGPFSGRVESHVHIASAGVKMKF